VGSCGEAEREGECDKSVQVDLRVPTSEERGHFSALGRPGSSAFEARWTGPKARPEVVGSAGESEGGRPQPPLATVVGGVGGGRISSHGSPRWAAGVNTTRSKGERS